MQQNRNSFSGSLGFILAAAGSAVGLGNIWRFPYLAARDGGGLFLVIYILLAVTFGFTLLITEVAVGRKSQQGPLTAYRFFHPRWGFIGRIAYLIPCIIYPYYCVIGGWVLKYLFTYVTLQGEAAAQDGFFTSFITDQWSPILFMVIFALICFFVIYRGVERGIEIFSRITMPLLLLLVIAICIYSLFITHTDEQGVTRTGLEGAAIYFIPNLEGITLHRFMMVVLDATSQLFFSLSVAMGIMVTYGSYMKKRVNLGKAVDHIEICDTVIAVLAGLMIIPAVYVFMGTEGMSAGPGLMFVALPKVFASLGFFGNWFSIAFFVLVFFAAMTSAASILEACVSSVMDRWHWSRTRSVCVSAAISLVASVVVCLGYNVFYFEYTLPNGATAQILDIFDYVSNNLLMPLLAICTCVLFGWIVGPQTLIEEIQLNGYRFWRLPLYKIMLRFVVPVLLIFLLVSAF